MTKVASTSVAPKENPKPDEIWAMAAPNLVQTCISRARAGDGTALRLAMERACPVKERAKVELPKIESAADLPRALGVIVEAAANGGLALTEATALCGMLSQMRQSFELVEMADRLEVIEARLVGISGATSVSGGSYRQ